MSYGKRLEINFMSYSGIAFTFDIYKRDYTGAVDERDGCPPAVKIDWGDGANDSMPCLLGSKATVVFYSETQGEFSELYAADNRQFYGELVDNYGQRYWRGWIVPEQRNETLGYKSPVSLTFLDGIGELKNMDFLDSTGAAYTGRHSYLYFILEILNKLETGMNVSMQVDFRPEGLSASQCPFENMFVDATIYEGLKCSEVLEQLLAGCRLMQTFNQTADSYWMVQSFASLQNYAKLTPGTTPTIEPVTFVSTPAGVVTLTGERPYIAINDDTLFHSDQPQFNNWSAWNYLDLKNTYSLIDNVLTNGSFEDDFSDWTPLVAMPSPLMDIFLLDDGTKALHVIGGTSGTGSRYDHKLLAKTFTGLKATTKSLRLSFKYNLYVGPTGKPTGESSNWIYVGCYITRDSDGAKIYCSRDYDLSQSKAYLKFDVAEERLYYSAWYRGFGVTATRDSEGNWTNTSITPAIAEKASEMIDFDILIKEIPADCSLSIVVGQYEYGEFMDDYRADYNVLYDDFALEFLDDGFLSAPQESNVRISNNIKCIENGDGFELLQGNVPNYENQRSIYKSYITDANDALVEQLQTSLTLTIYPYYELIARLLMSFHRRAALSVDFVVDVDEWLMPPHYVVYDPNSSAESFLAMVAFAFDFENSQASGNAVAILPFDEISTITYTEGEQATGASKSRSSSDGDVGHKPVSIAESSANILSVDVNQVLTIDLSPYVTLDYLDYFATLDDLHLPVTLGLTSEPELTLNEATQVLTLTGLKKTFLSLNDTFDAYPTQGYGNGLIAGTSAVNYSNSFGVDGEGFWAKRNKSFQSETVDLDFNIFSGYGHWTYGSEPYVWQKEQLADEYHSYRAAGWYYNTIKSTTIGWLPSANGFSNYNDLGAITSPDSFDLKKSDANGDIDYTIYILNLTGGSVKLYFSKVGGSSTLIGTLTPAYAQVKFFHIPEDGEYYITIEPLSTGIELGNIFCYWNEVAITDVYSEGIRVVDSAHQTQVIYPTHAGAAGDVCVLDDDAVTMVFKPLSESLTGVVLDTDFPLPGLMLTDGAGNYSVITDNSATWNTALVDADFASNGIMVRTGAGAYSTVADNSATWNTLASLGTKTFWNGTQAAYDAIGTKDSNTIYFINV